MRHHSSPPQNSNYWYLQLGFQDLVLSDRSQSPKFPYFISIYVIFLNGEQIGGWQRLRGGPVQGGGWVGPEKGELREAGTRLPLVCAKLTHNSTDGITRPMHLHTHENSEWGLWAVCSVQLLVFCAWLRCSHCGQVVKDTRPLCSALAISCEFRIISK